MIYKHSCSHVYTCPCSCLAKTGLCTVSTLSGAPPDPSGRIKSVDVHVYYVSVCQVRMFFLSAELSNLWRHLCHLFIWTNQANNAVYVCLAYHSYALHLGLGRGGGHDMSLYTLFMLSITAWSTHTPFWWHRKSWFFWSCLFALSIASRITSDLCDIGRGYSGSISVWPCKDIWQSCMYDPHYTERDCMKSMKHESFACPLEQISCVEAGNSLMKSYVYCLRALLFGHSGEQAANTDILSYFKGALWSFL